MKFLKQFEREDMLFIDIETANLVKELKPNTPLHDSWSYKVRYGSWNGEKYSVDEVTPEQLYKEKASLFAEFARIACISVGMIKNGKLRVKSYYNKDEKELLIDFVNVVNALQARNPKIVLAGHAITTFDNPFIMRRCMINGIDIPLLFDTAHLKPWEVRIIDSLALWKGQSYYSASLINITTAFGLQSPKDDIDGSQVNELFHNDELERIAKYCEKDVLAVANVIMKMRGNDMVELEEGFVKTEPVGTMEKINNTKKVSLKDKKVIDKVLLEFDKDDENKKKAEEILNIITKNM